MKSKKSFAAMLIGIVGILVVSGCIGSEATGNVVGGGNDGSGDYIRIPLSEISEKANLYSFDAEGTNVKFIVAEGSDGEPRTAFDACDVCGGYKGYRQVGNDVTCNNCGRSFKIDDLGTKNRGGGCWPSYLSHQIVGDDILIKKSELAAGKRWFA